MKARILASAITSITAIGIGAASHATVVINNGSAPPNSANVVASDPGDAVYVQAAGCDATVAHPCPAWGSQTTVLWSTGGIDAVEVLQDSRLIVGPGADRMWLAGQPICAHEDAEVVVDGATNAWVATPDYYGFCTFSGAFSGQITVESGAASLGIEDGTTVVRGGTVDVDMTSDDYFGDAHLSIEGGAVTLSVGDLGSTVEVHGGTVNQGQPGIYLSGASVDIHGGDIAAPLEIGLGPALDGSTVRIHGTDFEIDGAPAPFGVVGVSAGRLTGTLASGEPIDQDFEIYDFSSLSLVESAPPVVPALPPLGLGAAALGLLGCGAVEARRRVRVARPSARNQRRT